MDVRMSRAHGRAGAAPRREGKNSFFTPRFIDERRDLTTFTGPGALRSGPPTFGGRRRARVCGPAALRWEEPDARLRPGPPSRKACQKFRSVRRSKFLKHGRPKSADPTAERLDPRPSATLKYTQSAWTPGREPPSYASHRQKTQPWRIFPAFSTAKLSPNILQPALKPTPPAPHPIYKHER